MSIEQLRRVHTRILTQGNAGDADPPLVPPPAGTTALFVMATLHIFNTADPAILVETGLVTAPAIGRGKAIIKDTNVDVCWCADDNRNFSSVDVTDESAPAVLDQLLAISAGGLNQSMALDGTTIYLLAGAAGASASFINAINGSNPADLSITATYNMDSAFAVTQRFPRSIVSHLTTHRIYVINASTGIDTRFAVYNATTPGAITQQGVLTLTVAPAFSQACNLTINFPLVYALVGGNGSSIAAVLKIIDVTNPAAPSILSTTTIGLVTDLMQEVQVIGTTLYVSGQPLNGNVASASKILIFDVSNSAAPSLSSTITLTGLTRPVTSLFVRGTNIFAGAAGDGEAAARFVVYSAAGVQQGNEYGFSPAAVGAIALTGEP